MAHLNQIAMSVLDLRRTQRWYREVFGFQSAGGTRAFKGYLAEKVQGMPGARSTCWWMVDQQDYFQLELFEFERPAARPLPADWRLCDIGYGMVGLHVRDFETTLAALDTAGTPLLSQPLGEPGERRVCVRDPEGVLLEILEVDPLAGSALEPVRPQLPVTTRSISLSVADIEQSRAFFVDVLELEERADICLHQADHEELWGLTGARRKALVLQAGDVLVELVQYLDPIGRERSADYRISDQGLLNIALGFRSVREFNRIYQRCQDAGIDGNWRPLKLGAWSVVYVNDAQGFSVELLHVQPWYDSRMGFKPGPTPSYRRKRDMKPWQTAMITGGASGIGLELARRLLAEGVAVAAIDRDNNPSAEGELEAIGGKVAFFQADVTDEEGLKQAVNSATEFLGPADLVIHCAGIQIAKPFDELSGAEFEQVVRVNLVGSRNLAAAVLPHMLSGSQIALVASLAGLVPNHSYAAYNSSKFGVVGLAGALRLECISRGIEVSVVCPPEINTPMVVGERKTLPPVAARLKEAAGTLELAPACDSIMKQLRRRKVLIIPGLRARLVAWAGRVFPGLTRRLSERIVLTSPPP